MKTLIIALTTLSLLITNAIFAQSPATSTGNTLTVTVPIKSQEGKVGFALYNKATFMQQPLDAKETKAADGKAIVIFENVTPGEYAVVAYHDKNSDNRMNFQANGMPLEDYGCSNNVMSMGPPQWSDAKFEVKDTPVAIEIRF